MNDFLVTVFTLPTLTYSVLLAVCVVYWLLAAMGLFEVHGPHVHGGEAHVHVDGHAHDHDGDASGLAAMMAKLGLAGVPLMVVLTVLALVGWFASYFLQLLLLRHLPDALRIPVGVGVDVALLVPGLALTSLLLRPLSRWLLKLRPPADVSLLGRAGVVSTPQVSETHGQASFDDGGAGLVLQVRSRPGERHARGERVVLVEYLDAQHAWRVMSEQRFNAL